VVRVRKPIPGLNRLCLLLYKSHLRHIQQKESHQLQLLLHDDRSKPIGIYHVGPGGSHLPDHLLCLLLLMVPLEEDGSPASKLVPQ
jgi:hypothetical protein